jgi:hypothetical protein
MEKGIIFCGRERNIENYQLLLGLSYFGGEYNFRLEDRREFIQNIAYAFARKIVEQGSSLEIGIFNGWKISSDGKLIQIDKLLDTINLEKRLTEEVTRLSAGKSKTVIPISLMKN